jgi:hypothetical protein
MRKVTLSLLALLVLASVPLWYMRGVAAAAPVTAATSAAAQSKPAAEPPPEVPCPEVTSSQPNGDAADYKEVKCSEVTTACNGSPGSQKFDVDAFLLDKTKDTDVCLRSKSHDSVTWNSGKYYVQMLSYTTDGPHGKKPGHPFHKTIFGKGVPPFGNGHQSSVTSGHRRSVGQHGAPGTAGQCYEFKGVLRVVPTTGGDGKCYDPHIYTTCDTDCTLRTK